MLKACGTPLSMSNGCNSSVATCLKQRVETLKQHVACCSFLSKCWQCKRDLTKLLSLTANKSFSIPQISECFRRTRSAADQQLWRHLHLRTNQIWFLPLLVSPSSDPKPFDHRLETWRATRCCGVAVDGDQTRRTCWRTLLSTGTRTLLHSRRVLGDFKTHS